MKLVRGQRVQLTIDRLSVGGRGVGRVSTENDDLKRVVVFVSDTAPDEDVEVEITFVKKNFVEGRLLKILRPSKSRVVPRCPVAGRCGGCNWQHLSYPEQLTQKRELVRESLRKFSGFDVSLENSVQPTVPSPKEFRYRNRVQFHHDRSSIGFYERGSHRIVNIDDCPITEEPIAELIPAFRERFAKSPKGRFEAYLTEDGAVRTRGPGHDERAPANDAPNANEEQGGLNFSFSQVNTGQNENLVAAVVDIFKALAAEQKVTKIYDLYAGAGNFTFPLLNALVDVTAEAVELNLESVERGRARAQSNYPDREFKWFGTDVLTYLQNHELERDSLVLIDPPRTGCDPEVMKLLAESKISSLVYVSCHPATLARDLKFMNEAGFRLSEVRPFDMFPQTDHVETLVTLRR